MQTLDVCRKSSGKIWHRKPMPSSSDGLVVSISHSIPTSMSLPCRQVRFQHAAFDSMGDTFVAADHQGNVFLFDISKNRFSLAQRTGTSCTVLAFTLRRKSEFLIGMSDYSLKCYDTDTKELVAWMKGHESAIHSVSVHASGRYAMTSSVDSAQLWDLDTFQRKRKLNIKGNVDIIQVFFLPLSNTIISCFKDDTIFAWESDTLNCKFQLPVPEGKSPNYKTFAASRDGRLLAAGCRSRFVHLWNIDTKNLLRIVELPSKVTSVRQVEFMPDKLDGGASQILGVLCQDGLVRFINIHTCKLLFDVGSLDQRISNMSISPTGRHMIAVMEDGQLNIYNLQTLSSELNKPPPPLVKLITSNKMANTTSTTQSSKSTSRSRSSRGKENRQGRQPGISWEDSNEEGMEKLPDGLSMNRLLAILRGYGEYPAKYRMFIWRSILRLPENHAAYAALVDKGTHPAFAALHESYPIKSRKLLRVLQRLLSALAHWSPIFGETDYLPALAFPFVKLFQNNHLICFEIVASVLVSWSQHWFEYFPNPPINVLSIVENIIAHHDRHLLQHFVKYGVTSQIYAWPLLHTLFSEVLTREEWLSLWDNVFSNHPSFLLMVVAAYTLCARAPLLRCTELDDFKYFFNHHNAVDLKQVIREAYRLTESTPDDIHPMKSVDDATPLTKGQYPVFNKYPKFIVDFQVQERERIRQEELEYLRQKQMSLALEQETSHRQQEEEAWYRQQQLLQEAEEKRRRMIQEEEHKLVEQRKRITAMSREVKLKELQLLDAARRKFLHFQKTQRETELKRLDDEVQRKTVLRDQETAAAIEEAEIKNMELQLQKKMFEQEMFRDYEQSSQMLRSEHDAHRKQQELEDKIRERVQIAEQQREVEVRRLLQQGLAKSTQANVESWAQNEMEYKQRADDLNIEMRQVQLSKLHAENQCLEQEVQHLMRTNQESQDAQSHQRQTELEEQQQLASEANCRRLQHIEDEANLGVQHTQHLHDLAEDTLEKLSNYHIDHSDRETTESVTSTEDSLQAILDKQRKNFDERERSLLQEARALRQRLAVESRNRKPPPPLSLDN